MNLAISAIVKKKKLRLYKFLFSLYILLKYT